MNNDFVNKYAALIWGISKRFYNIDKEDLYQAGCLGLIKAYNNYENQFGDFSSYAYKYIFGEMYDLSIKNNNMKVPKDIIKLYNLLLKTSSILCQQFNRNITIKELSEYLNIDVDKIEYVYSIMNRNITDIDEVQIGFEEKYVDDLIMKETIDSLDPLSSKIIKYRYLCDYTQSEVGEMLGINQVKVSRMEKEAKSKILEYIN